MSASPETPARIQSFADFWPYYVSEHRDPRCRWLHFVGTSGFLLTLLSCLAATPLRLGAAIALSAVLIVATNGMEAKRSAAPVLLAIIAMCGVANPAVLIGVVFAYAGAWVGHFIIEKNRPATFTYPMWSLAGDFRMYGWMWTGRLWTGRGEEVAPLAS